MTRAMIQTARRVTHPPQIHPSHFLLRGTEGVSELYPGSPRRATAVKLGPSTPQPFARSSGSSEVTDRSGVAQER